jgi:hypothetical protein
MMRATYTDKQRSEALRLYEEQGPGAAAKATGIPKGTISSWARRAGAQTVCTEETRARVEARRVISAERRQLEAWEALEAAAKVRLDITSSSVKHTTVTDGGEVVTWDAPHRPRERYYLARTYEILAKAAQLLSGQATDRPNVEVSGLEPDTDVQAAVSEVIDLVERRRERDAG